MESYLTIQNINHSVVKFGGSGAFGGTCSGLSAVYTYDAPVPSPATRYYEPYSVESWKPNQTDRDSFSRIRKDGVIKMTPYSRGRIVTEKFIIRHKGMSAALGWPHCTDGSWFSNKIRSVSTWDECFTIDDCEHLSAEPFERTDTEYDHYRARNEAMSSCVRGAVQQFDALTESAEFPETFRFIRNFLNAVISPTKAYQKAVRRIRKDKFAGASALADAWLQYRYAIMPIVYSVQDAMELLESRNFLYDSSRGFASVPAGLVFRDDGSPERFVTSDISGETVYRATCKSKYGSVNNKLWSKTSIDPMLTAWEVIPLSFVVDWFINVGDVLLSRSAEVDTPSIERKFCLSTKVNTTQTWYHHQREHFRSERIYPQWNDSVVYESPLRSSAVMKKVVTQTYDRVLFQPSDISITLNDTLSGVRLMDAAALLLKPALTALKALK